jgi:hypothetical protein
MAASSTLALLLRRLPEFFPDQPHLVYLFVQYINGTIDVDLVKMKLLQEMKKKNLAITTRVTAEA